MSGTVTPVELEQDAAAWETWLAGWEQYLAAALALPQDPDAPAPSLPADPIPLGPVPANLNDRLLRAQAVREAAVAAITTRMAQLSPGRAFTAAAAQPRAPRPVIDL